MGTAQIGKAECGTLDEKALTANYKALVALFKSVQRNTPKIMYSLIRRVYTLGTQINPKYTIKNHLCKDLNISYKQYRFYCEYKLMDTTKEQIVKNKHMSYNTMLYILHRFPYEEVDYVIDLMLKYDLSRDDLDTLKKQDKYKNEEEWKEISDNKDYKSKRYGLNSKKDSRWNNLRRIRGSCMIMRKLLKNIYCVKQNTKYEIYEELFQTYNTIGNWLSKHKDWDINEQKNR